MAKCKQCNLEINKAEKYCMIATYFPKPEKPAKNYYHFGCWIAYFNGCVIKKAKESTAEIQKHIIGITEHPMIKNILKDIPGTDSVLAMLNKPLTKEDINKEIKKATNGKETDK